ncbi:MAG: BamA/TamA family outer membrane protein [Pseudomonadota bacterium]
MTDPCIWGRRQRTGVGLVALATPVFVLALALQSAAQTGPDASPALGERGARGDPSEGSGAPPGDTPGGVAPETAPDEREGKARKTEEAEPSSGLFNRESAPKVDFDVAYPDDLDKDLHTALKAVSTLEDKSLPAPATLGQVLQRADQDMDRFKKVLQSRGYFAGAATYRVDRSGDPLTIRIRIDEGEVFRLALFDIIYASPVTTEDAPRDAPDVGLAIDGPVTPAQIVAAEQLIQARLSRGGHPFVTVEERSARANLQDSTLSVVLRVAPGPAARFGKTRYEGVDRVEEDFIRRNRPWKEGDIFDTRRLAEFDEALETTGLFETAAVRADETVGADGLLPVTVTIKERKPRIVQLGLKYSTTNGVGVTASWTHRNLFGYGERLTAKADLAQNRRLIGLDYQIPQFTGRRQTAFAQTQILQETSDAFEEDSWTTAAGLEKTFTRSFSLSAAIALDIANVTDLSVDPEEEQATQLVSFPLTARFDNTDSLLDPTRGVRTAASIEPHTGLLENEALTFFSSELNASTYLRLVDSGRLVLAGRTRLASISGAETDDLPADERYYAGGGGSLRGYGFREAGPLSDDDDPLGGTSAFEAGLELRGYVTQAFGLAGFVEGGNVYDSTVPEFGEDLLWSAGLGLRYRTPVGPIRADIAVPLDRRDLDAPFQFYVSIGQAF